MDPDARERQRTLDVDMAIHLSRARQKSVSVSPEASPLKLREHDDHEPEIHPHHEESTFPSLFLQEEREMEIARGEMPRQVHIDDPYRGMLIPHDLRQDLGMTHHLAQNHEPHFFAGLHSAAHHIDGVLPLYQPPALLGRQTYNFAAMEDFAMAEKTRLGLATSAIDERLQYLRVRKPSQLYANDEVGSSVGTANDFRLPATHIMRERKLSQSNALPRRHGGGKMALFEGIPGAPPASLAAGLAPPLSVVPSFADLPSAMGVGVGHDRPYRFSFYSNSLSATIHARSLCELPADGQSFEDLFTGVGGPSPSPTERQPGPGLGPQPIPPVSRTPREETKGAQGANSGDAKNLVSKDTEGHTWWLDVLSPTDEEMKLLSKVCLLVSWGSRITNHLRIGFWHPSTDSGRYPDGRSARENRALPNILSRLFQEFRSRPL
jgi:magnesium transporter